MNRRLPLIALAGAQFIMVLDQSVMNVSISALVDEFDTTVGTIQAVITLYCLVMAMFMLTGGKIGDIIGRRRAFVIGLVIYGIGSGINQASGDINLLGRRALNELFPPVHRNDHRISLFAQCKHVSFHRLGTTFGIERHVFKVLPWAQ